MPGKRISILTVAAIMFAALGVHFFWSHNPPNSELNEAPIGRATSKQPTAALPQSTPSDAGAAEDASSRAIVSRTTASMDSSGTVERSMDAALRKTERAFDAESVDSLWSLPTEGRILGEIAQITGLEALTVQVQCRTTMCRIELAERGQLEPGRILPANAAFGRLVLGLDQQPLWIMTAVDRYGTPSSLAYVARDHLDASNGQLQ